MGVELILRLGGLKLRDLEVEELDLQVECKKLKNSLATEVCETFAPKNVTPIQLSLAI